MPPIWKRLKSLVIHRSRTPALGRASVISWSGDARLGEPRNACLCRTVMCACGLQALSTQSTLQPSITHNKQLAARVWVCLEGKADDGQVPLGLRPGHRVNLVLARRRLARPGNCYRPFSVDSAAAPLELLAFAGRGESMLPSTTLRAWSFSFSAAIIAFHCASASSGFRCCGCFFKRRHIREKMSVFKAQRSSLQDIFSRAFEPGLRFYVIDRVGAHTGHSLAVGVRWTFGGAQIDTKVHGKRCMMRQI